LSLQKRLINGSETPLLLLYRYERQCEPLSNKENKDDGANSTFHKRNEISDDALARTTPPPQRQTGSEQYAAQDRGNAAKAPHRADPRPRPDCLGGIGLTFGLKQTASF
jgi:hypothetical protein